MIREQQPPLPRSDRFTFDIHDGEDVFPLCADCVIAADNRGPDGVRVGPWLFGLAKEAEGCAVDMPGWSVLNFYPGMEIPDSRCLTILAQYFGSDVSITGFSGDRLGLFPVTIIGGTPVCYTHARWRSNTAAVAR